MYIATDEESNGVGKAASSTASWFSKQPHMAHIAAPVGPETFCPMRDDLEQLILLAGAVPIDERSVAELRIDAILSQFRSTVSYVEPLKPEENFCRHNLDAYVRAIVDCVDDRMFCSIEAQAVSREIMLCVAPKTTNPEPVVVWRPDHATIGLIATEAKALFTALFACCAQAIQMAADLAMWLCRMYPKVIVPSTVIVPFILCSWEHFQIGCVYLMDDAYPCAVLLTGALSVAVPSERQQIARWGVALAEHCKRMGARIKAMYHPGSETIDNSDSRYLKKRKTNTSSSSSASSSGTSVETNWEYSISASCKLFYKPIACADLPRATLARIMSVFYRLQRRGSAECKAAVCFPEGVIGLPASGEAFQQNLFDFIMRKWTKYYDIKRISVSLDEFGYPAGYSVGHPIIVYRFLDRSWTSAVALLEAEYSKEQREAFVSALTVVLGLFISVGVVHMDVRLPNIFFKFDTKGIVRIKVIDWDDALLLGDNIPVDVQQFVNSNVANADCHSEMVADMRRELEL